MWWLLGLVLVAAIALTTWVLVRRRRPSADARAAYAATVALRDRLAVEAATPSATPATVQRLADDAAGAVRAARAAEPDASVQGALARTLEAVEGVRDALALRSAAQEGAHADTGDAEAATLRALAALDAALGPLGDAVGHAPGDRGTVGPS